MRPASGWSIGATRWAAYSSTAVGVRRDPADGAAGRPVATARRSRRSIATSMASSSLRPPRAKNLMPLSGIGLCEAESITPRSAPSAPVRKATPGVGSTPSSSTSTPAEARPATTAASRNCPEMRVSRPTTANGRWPSKSPASAEDVGGGNGEVQGELGGEVDRWPGPGPRRCRRVESCERLARSALAELGRLAGLLQTGLLALDDARVAGEQAGLLQRRAVGLDVDRVEARATPRRSAPAWPVMPPPWMRAMTSKRPTSWVVTNGSLTTCWCSLLGK